MFRIFLGWALLLFSAEARCPGWCNRRGTCTDPGDAGHCVCEMGYSGEGCELKLCPKSFDPFTLQEKRARRALRISTSVQSGGQLAGKFLFGFFDDYVEIGASLVSMSEASCSNSFSSLRGVDRAECVYEAVNDEDGSGSYVVQFMSWPAEPFENNIFNHSGNPPLSSFSCSPADSALADGAEPECSIVDVPAENIPDYLQCSGRGTCDAVTGACACERGFKGPACNDMTDDQDHSAHIHDGPFFSATVLKAAAIRSPSPDFNLFQAAMSLHGNSWTNITTIRGDGLFEHRGEAAFSGGVVLSPRVNRDTLEVRGTTTLAVKGDALAPEDLIMGRTLTMIETALGRDDDTHIRSLTRGEEVFSVSGAGDVIVRSVSSADRSFRLDQGMLSVQNAEVSSSLNVGGAIHVEDSLTLGSGFVLNPQGMTIDAATHAHAMLEIRSRAADFSGPLLEVKAASPDATFLRGIVEDTVTFDLSAKGDLTLNKVAMKSGGIEVRAGGIRVESGGMNVHGGFTLASGVLDVRESSLTSRNIRIVNSGSHSVGTSGTDTSDLLSIMSNNQHFAGAGIDIAVDESADASDYFFIRARHNSSEGQLEPVFSVSGSGAVQAGDMRTSGRLDVGEDASFNGIVSLARLNIAAGKIIRIPVNASFVTITDDRETHANEVVFESPHSPAVGTIVIVSNTDADFTSGAAAIPPGSTILFIYDGNAWTAVDALRAPMRELLHVTDLKASNDLSIGNVTFEAARFKLSPDTLIPKSALLYLSGSGFVTGTPKLTFSNGVLSTTAASIDRLAGDLDAAHRNIRDAILSSPVLVNASVLANDIVMPSQKKGGVAYFDDAGRLTTMATLRLNEQGMPIFEEVTNDLNMKNNKLMNADIRSSTLKDITEASIVNLKIQTLSEVTEPDNSIAVFDKGYLRSTNNAASIDKEGHLKVASISGFRLKGRIHGEDFNFEDINIAGKSSFHGLSLSTSMFRLANKNWEFERPYNTHSVLSMDKYGLVTPHDPSEELRFQRVRVFENMFVEGNIELKRGALQGASIENSPLGEFEDVVVAGKLKLSGTVGRDSVAHVPQKLLAVNEASGTVETLADVHLTEDGSIKINRGINAVSLMSDRLTVSNLAHGGGPDISPIGVDGNGMLINSKQFSFDDLHLKKGLTVDGSVVVKQLSFKDVTRQGLLQVDANGIVATSSSVNLEDVVMVTSSVRDHLTAGSVTISGLGGSTASSRVAIVGPDGKVEASTSIDLEKIVTQRAVINELIIDSSVVIKKLSVAPANQVLGMQADGSLTASNEINLNKVQVTESVVTPLLKAEKIILGGLSQNLLGTDADGNIVSTHSVDVDSIVSKSVDISDTLKASKIHIKDLAGQSGSVLVVEGGNVKGSKSLQIDEMKTNTIDVSDSLSVSGNIRLNRIKSVDSSKTSVLSVSSDGNVVADSALSLTSMTTSSLEVSDTVTFKSLRSLNEGVDILTVDSMGRLATGGKASLASLVVDNVDISRGTVESLHMPSRKEFGANENTAPLVVNLETSEVGVASDFKSKSITAKEAMKSEGSATFVGDVMLPSLQTSAILHTDASGRVKASKDLDLGLDSTVRAGSLKGRVLELSEGLKLTALVDNTVSDTILAVDGRTGLLKSAGQNKMNTLSLRDLRVDSVTADEVKISNIKDAEQFLDNVLVISKSGSLEKSQHISVKQLRAFEEVVTPALRASSIYMDGVHAGGLLSLTNNGEVQVAGPDASVTLSNAKVTGLLSVDGSLDVKSLKLSGSSAGVVVSNSDGALSVSDSILLSNVQITGTDSSARRLSVTDALRLPSAATPRGDAVRSGVLSLTTDASEVTLSNSARLDTLEASTIKVTGVATLSKLALSDVAGRGDNTVLSLNSGTGYVEAKTDISVSSVRAEEITVRRIVPGDKSAGIEITGATMSGSTLIQSGATIRGAVEIETGALSVTRGPAHFAAGVDVDGTLEVRGHVIGSGPYHDSSDVRFKTNVERVSGALESIKTLNAVKYDFRVEEFPERQFDAGRQMGWLAHEVEAVAPELVVRDTDGYMHVSYAHASALVAQAVRELAEEVQVLRGQVETLQRELQAARNDASA